MPKRVAYVLQQAFCYEYPGPITDLRHRLVVAPPHRHGDQRRVSHRLTVEPDFPLAWRTDRFGNAVATVETPHIERAVRFSYEALIQRGDGPAPHLARTRLADLRAPSRLTMPSPALAAAAAALPRAGNRDAVLAERINALTASHMRYVSGVTTVETTAAQAFEQGAGVCQDFAHVMLALCRLRGLAARYVSGHLLGEGGTHAWVEVACPSTDGSAVLLAFDPTHARRATLDYVFVAAGRDYADVAPTSGRFVAPYVGRFTTSRVVARVESANAAGDAA